MQSLVDTWLKTAFGEFGHVLKFAFHQCLFFFMWLLFLFVTETIELWGNSLMNTKEIKNMYLTKN